MVFDMIPNAEYRMGNNVVPFMMSVILIVFLHYKIYLKLLPEALFTKAVQCLFISDVYEAGTAKFNNI